ncbi:uracil-DNA glycosylase [Gorillibacterium timonense]|uniref:uracil-DNA glycosylase n=1 Tax=Gorillibacterium timonense TaxID=1689269 RepID=UPI00071D37B6|nr:uracil-DNA glycosylase [Gorillibacterium timonense]
MTILRNDWSGPLKGEFDKPYYRELRTFLAEEYRTGTIFPDMYDIFNSLHTTPLHKVKAVILGQDPYHGPGQAHGLSFSVKPGVPVPPSLRNMLQELHEDLGCRIPNHGHLTHWAQQGVLLLNTVLTVRSGEANSHKGKGWEAFTDKVIQTVNTLDRPVVFLLWGSPAQSKLPMIDASRHGVIRSPHPSPLSAHRGFFGSRPYSRTNQFLRENGQEPIDWQLPQL